MFFEGPVMMTRVDDDDDEENEGRDEGAFGAMRVG